MTVETLYGLTCSVLSRTSPTTVEVLLRFRAESPAKQAGDGSRPPLSLSLVIDKSGSMAGKPLENAIKAAELVLEYLGPQDRISVVAYDDMIETVVKPCQVTDRLAIAKDIRKIRPGRATNLSGGWLQGCAYALDCPNDFFIRRVIVLTDGQANIGITDFGKMCSAVKEKAGTGVSTTTIGLGRDFQEDWLIGMAEAGGGNYYYIETPEDAAQIFQIEAESLISVAAQNLKVTLIPNRNAGVKIEDIVNWVPSNIHSDDSWSVSIGDVISGEDKFLAIKLSVPEYQRPEGIWGHFLERLESMTGGKSGPASDVLSLLEVIFTCDVLTTNHIQQVSSGQFGIEVQLGTPDQVAAASPNLDVLQVFTRMSLARAKDLAQGDADAKRFNSAAATLREAIKRVPPQLVDRDYEFAEDLAQLEYFAALLEQGKYDAALRKLLRDQSHQARTRNRSDLAIRGTGGGSAQNLETAQDLAGGVKVQCVREGGKLRLKALSAGYDSSLNVLFPRAIREEGTHYVVDGLELNATGTFYRPVGKIRRFTNLKTPKAEPASSDPTDVLALTELFAGGGEPWLPLLKSTIEAQPDAASFIGPSRDKSIVPVRELTFQALKPNPPEKWKVVIFGQNPYPRVESATGIAMFDNTFSHWKDSQFGKVTSIRCIIKAATMWKNGIPKATPIADIRTLLAKQNTVQPPEWFQAMLTQGVLLLNAALTASSDATRTNAQEIARHTAFWKPVVEKIVAEILSAKQTADQRNKGVVFVWWGSHARALRTLVERLQKKYPGVPVKHIDHPNPAAQGDIFCDGNHFGDVNHALQSLGMDTVDWLPAVGWNKGAVGTITTTASQLQDADRMGDFITKTMELHKFYLERLQEVKDEGKVELPAIFGIMETPLVSIRDAIASVTSLIQGIEYYGTRSVEFARRKISSAGSHSSILTEDEIAALYLYTCESAFYRQMNAALRDPDRGKVKPYYRYLRLLLSALSKLERQSSSLWRGVAMDLRAQYPKNGLVTWWGVSSCTSKLSVAQSFLGSRGKRTLFEVRPATAVSIKQFSAFTGEEEYLLAPGTRLKVLDVELEKTGLCTVKLEEQTEEKGIF